jgi:hypothetical protein
VRGSPSLGDAFRALHHPPPITKTNNVLRNYS